MSTSPNLGASEDNASGLSCGFPRGKSGDSSETVAALNLLWKDMKRGEQVSLALLSSLSPDQLRRQMTDEARGLIDVLFTFLARLDRDSAEDFLGQLLDLHRRRVLPELRRAENLDLFGAMGGRR